MDKAEWYAAWKTAVANANTLLGYWQWVEAQKLTHEAEAWEQFINKLKAEDDISYMERLAHTGNVHKVPYETGPGLKELFDRKTLPASGRPVTEENVRQQLRDPHEKMPSFANRLADD